MPIPIHVMHVKLKPMAEQQSEQLVVCTLSCFSNLAKSVHHCNHEYKTRLAPVQSVLNAAVRMIARLPPYSHISENMINELHWLQILARVRYKVLLLVAKSQQG